MTWRGTHPCEDVGLPRARQSFTLEMLMPAKPPASYELGRLARCSLCGRLWRVGFRCSICDPYGARPHNGGHWLGLMWRPARLRDRWRAWRRGI